jgi:hypothetical protein
VDTQNQHSVGSIKFTVCDQRRQNFSFASSRPAADKTLTPASGGIRPASIEIAIPYSITTSIAASFLYSFFSIKGAIA